MVQSLFQKNIITTALITGLLLLATLFVPFTTHAVDSSTEIQRNTRCGSNINLSGNGNCSVSGNSTKIEDLIKTVINIFSAIVGAVSVIMIIVGGFRYITSGGDSNNVGAAKNTILYAIVGLVIVAVAQIIVQFVLERATT